MGWRLVVWAVALGPLWAGQVVAHHPVSAIYDEGQVVTIEGTVTRMVYQMPHPRVDLAVESSAGPTRTWAIEFDELKLPDMASASRPTLKPGDRITVCGNPGRDPGEYRLRMLALVRSDGLSLRSKASLADAQCAG
jgi:hypothetical protein